MALEALFQFGMTKPVKNEVIKVDGQSFTISPEIQIFVGGKAVKASEVQDKIKAFSSDERKMLKKQLADIQSYSNTHSQRLGSKAVIERYDFEACTQIEGANCRNGVSYSYDDDGTVTLGCANGKLNLVW